MPDPTRKALLAVPAVALVVAVWWLLEGGGAAPLDQKPGTGGPPQGQRSSGESAPQGSPADSFDSDAMRLGPGEPGDRVASPSGEWGARLRVRCVRRGRPVPGVLVVVARDRACLHKSLRVAQPLDASDWAFDPALANVHVPVEELGQVGANPPVDFDGKGWRASWGVSDTTGWAEVTVPQGEPYLLGASRLGYYPLDAWAMGTEALEGAEPRTVRMEVLYALVAQPTSAAPITWQQTHDVVGAEVDQSLTHHSALERSLKALQTRFPGCPVSVAMGGVSVPTADFLAHTADGRAWRLSHAMRPYPEWSEPIRMQPHWPEGHGVLSVTVRERGTSRVLPMPVQLRLEAQHRFATLQPGDRLVALAGTWSVHEVDTILGEVPTGFPHLVKVEADGQHDTIVWVERPIGRFRVVAKVSSKLPVGPMRYEFHGSGGMHVAPRSLRNLDPDRTMWLPLGSWRLELSGYPEVGSSFPPDAFGVFRGEPVDFELVGENREKPIILSPFLKHLPD